MGPYTWHSQLFELFFVWLPTWGYIIGVTPNNIDSQAQVEHHGITGDWKKVFQTYISNLYLMELRDYQMLCDHLDKSVFKKHTDTIPETRRTTIIRRG